MLEEIKSELRKQSRLLEDILHAIRKIEKRIPPLLATRFQYMVGGEKVNKMQTQDNTPVVVAVQPVDALGNPASLASGVTVAFSVDNTAIGTVAPNAADASGLSCVFTPNPAAGNLGTCNIQAAASDGSAQGSAPMTVVGGPDVGFTFSQSAVPAPAAVSKK